jgi:4-hydroxy-4-methyl-2-oxoglutarate aldolase
MDASFEHVPAIPPRIVRDVPRLDPIWLKRFAEVSSCDISDHVGRLYTVEGVEALYRPIQRMVGQALTVKPWPGDGLAVHGAASLAQDGDVLVVDARGYTGVTGAGFKMLAGPRARGLRGYVIDGALRDVEDFQEVGFPVFGRGRAVHSSTKRRPGEINVPISCGGVIIEAGDLIVGDGDGVVVVPRAHIATIWELVSAGPPPVPTDPEEIAAADAKRRENYERAFAREAGVEFPFVDRTPGN